MKPKDFWLIYGFELIYLIPKAIPLLLILLFIIQHYLSLLQCSYYLENKCQHPGKCLCLAKLFNTLIELLFY